ncbi:MAG TPA: hypothetical protein VL308_11840 [Gemmatimonadaceae bacterium]|jgi:hypothetical protein|nr:hypothetical protein [Gemmatimonadaceae bacterium]HTK52573.1 hypothetical protein [Gemmatimonadaceae bacterium]
MIPASLSHPNPHSHPFVGTVEHLGRRYDVTCHVSHDGIEYVGRLWFNEEGTDADAGLPDRSAIPGRTREDVLDYARRLTPRDLILRYRRAVSERRRYFKLRHETDEILAKIRYLNQIAISVRRGLLDEAGANQEIDLTERQLHESIERLRHNAGIEG